MKRLLIGLIITSLSATLAITNANAHEYSGLIKSRKFQEAEKATSAKLAADPKNADALIAKMESILFQNQFGRLEEGMQYGEQCVAAHPNRSKCHEMLGNLYSIKIQGAGTFAAISLAGKIKSSFLKAVELDTKNYGARSSLNQFYLNAPGVAGGGLDKAQALVAETSKLNADAGSLLQARVELKEGRPGKAESLVMAANVAGNDDLEIIQQSTLVSLGSVYRDKKQWADSERVLNDAIKRYPLNPSALHMLGRTYAAQERHAEAIAAIDKAIAIDARAYFIYRLALSHQALGDKTKAIALFERALAKKADLDKKQREDAEQQLRTLKA
jgi:tetratricopeptide (TPR) repeat protein